MWKMKFVNPTPYDLQNVAENDGKTHIKNKK